jgi:hypothetical protein
VRWQPIRKGRVLFSYHDGIRFHLIDTGEDRFCILRPPNPKFQSPLIPSRRPTSVLKCSFSSGQMPGRIDSYAMDLGDILTRDQIITDLKATNRWEAIDELIKNLSTTGKIKPEHHDAIAAVVKKRESSMSTGIGFGIGIPHASTDLIYEVVGALGRSKKRGQL